MSTNVDGWVAPGYEKVRQCFEAHFDDSAAFAELGAGFAVYRGEQLVVDLWGGHQDQARQRPWSRDTLVNVWSATKGVTAIAVALLVERGLLSYDAPVAAYWPEFAHAGKADTTVSQLLSHQAGLPGITEPTTIEDLYDWQLITERLAHQAPLWPPGTKSAYHAVTFGYLAGELIRRTTKHSPGQWLQKELSGPLGADVYIGVPEQEDLRVAPIVPPVSPPLDIDLSQLPPEIAAVAVNPGLDASWALSRRWRAAEIPAANGHATAAGLAGLFALLANGGSFRGVELFRQSTIAALAEVQSRAEPGAVGPSGWTRGMHSNMGGVFGPNPNAFGHVGWGGSMGAVDLEKKIAMGYVCNRMDAGNTGDPRAVELTKALYACL